MFHSFDREIFEDVKTLIGEERIEVELNARIKWAGGYFRYHLQIKDMIEGIPFFKLCRQVSGLFSAQFKNTIVRKTPKDAEEALIQLYEKPLYKFFFEDFASVLGNSSEVVCDVYYLKNTEINCDCLKRDWKKRN